MPKLPIAVIREDAALDRSAETAGRKLCELRWHWTLDESNPERVSFAQYGRDVSRNRHTIREYAIAHTLILDARVSTVDEGRRRAKLSAEREAATEAVAASEGIGFRQAHETRRPAIESVVAIARDRSERHDSTVSEELPAAVESWRRQSHAHKSEVARQRRASFTNWNRVELHLANARHELRKALAMADIDWTEEQREFIADEIAKLRELLELSALWITGETGTDWDAELERLGDQ